MKRYPHYWWPLRGNKYPSRIAVLDCDSLAYPDEASTRVEREELTEWFLRSTQFADGRPTATLYQRGIPEEWLWRRLAAMLAGKSRVWLFCPNASRVLGLIGFWPRLESGEITLAGSDRRVQLGNCEQSKREDGKLLVIEDPPTVILCRIGNLPGKLLILDVRNWGFELIERSVSCGDRTLRYMEGVCDCVHALRTTELGTLRGTAGSQAVSSLRSYPHCVRLHCHTRSEVLSLERNAYHGGRCEATRLGPISGPIYHVDVRNMYPSICLDLPVPTSLVRYGNDSRAESVVANCGGNNCAAYVRLKTYLPMFPLRIREGTIYPAGSFNAYLCGAELSRAIAQGNVTRWHSAAEYHCQPLLRTYYQEWLDMLSSARSSGRVFVSQWIKHVMNALPGKFAEPGRRWVSTPTRPEMGPYGRWTETDGEGNVARWRNIAWNTQREEVTGESYWSMPSVAAWITSAGRMRLWDYIQQSGRENVWYYDTDSLLVNEQGYGKLLSIGAIREGEVGYLRTLGRYSTGHIWGIRHYVLDGKVLCAGVPRGTIEPAETRGAYWLRRRLAAGHDMGSAAGASRELMDYPSPSEYHHGRVNPDGSITPWEVSL